MVISRINFVGNAKLELSADMHLGENRIVLPIMILQ